MKLPKFIALSLVGLGPLSGCDGDNEPTAPAEQVTLSAQDQEALVSTLRNSAGFGGFAGFELVIPQLESAGTIIIDGVEYAAVGIQLDLTILLSEGGRANLQWTGLLAWTGLDASARTVEEIIHVIASGLLAGGDVVELGGLNRQAPFSGIAVVLQPPSGLYVSSAGTFGVTSVAFGAEESCPVIGEAETECVIARGTMSGSFDFTADALSAEGSVMRSAEFEVPAARIRAVAEAVPLMPTEH